ncbi:MAG: 2-oxo acid dehydrogenase subunit E2, partial [Promethearchaeota archaeon]
MGRYDGTKPMNLSPYKIVEPYAISTRTGAQVFFQATYDLVKTLPYIEKYNKDRRLDKTNRLTLFHVILCAAARGIAKYPHLNRFISGRKYYQRNRLNFSFVVKKQLTPNAPESIAKVDLSPYETLDTIR